MYSELLIAHSKAEPLLIIDSEEIEIPSALHAKSATNGGFNRVRHVYLEIEVIATCHATTGGFVSLCANLWTYGTSLGPACTSW